MFGGKVRAQGTCDELLIQSDSTMLQTGELDVEAVEAVEAALGRFGKHIEKVEHPRQKLESLFLDIVQRAQAEGVSTSGAQSGGRLAEFLASAPQVREAEEPQRVLDQLTAKKPETAPQADLRTTPLAVPSPRPAASAPAAPPPAAEAKPDEKVLGQLMAAQWGATKEAPAEPAAPPTRAPSTPARPAAAPSDPNSEKPDSSFLDALTKVEPYKDEDDAGKSKPSGGA